MNTNHKNDSHPVLFPFVADDQGYIGYAAERIRALLAHPHLTPSQIRTFARLLYGLRRLPRATQGLDIHAAFGHKFEDAVSSFDLYLSAENFIVCSSTLENIGTVDTFSTFDTVFEIETSGHRADSNEDAMHAWMKGFDFAKHTRLNIEDLSDESAWDWDDDRSSSYWERLEAERDS